MLRRPPGLRFFPIVPLVFALPAAALEIRGFSQTLHRRLVDFPGEPVYPQTPVVNPTFFVPPAAEFHAIGWPGHPTDWTRQMALVSPRHFIYATHYPLGADWQIVFLGADGNQHSFGIEGSAPVINSLGQQTDLTVYTLDSEVDAAAGIQPFRVLNLAGEADYEGLPMVVCGSFVTAGAMPVDGFTTLVDDPGFDTTRFAYFDYDTSGGGSNECTYRGGDSGAPVFIMTDDEPALVGIASGRDDFPALQKERNYLSFLPAYLPQVDALMEPLGYHVRRVHPESAVVTAGAGISALVPGQAGDAVVSLANAGPGEAHNPTMELSFSSPPDSVTGVGWICEAVSAGVWNCRRGGIDASATSAIDAYWDSIPDVREIGLTVSTAHDGGGEFQQFVLPVVEGYSSWIDGADDTSPAGDPDRDGLSNLVEFAFGGDAGVASPAGMGGQRLGPSLETGPDGIVVRYPRRTDAAERGLSDAAEFATDPETWTSVPPQGLVVESEPLVPGFEQVTLLVPAESGVRFVRVRVVLE